MKNFIYYWNHGLMAVVVASSRREADRILYGNCPMARPMLDSDYHAKSYDFRVEEKEIDKGPVVILV